MHTHVHIGSLKYYHGGSINTQDLVCQHANIQIYKYTLSKKQSPNIESVITAFMLSVQMNDNIIYSFAIYITHSS